MTDAAEIGSDEQPGCLAPRARYDLFGHEAAAEAIETAWSSGRMHHAWLITGPRGVGKATLAWRAVRRILGAQPAAEMGTLGSRPDDPICRVLEAHACPDFLLLRRPWDDKRKKWRAEITVEEARRAPSFFEMSAGAGGWRACLVDSADDMNTNAANALLKTLEEPPHQGVLILLAHAPGRLPATIRSRCRHLALRAPEVAATADWLAAEAGDENRETCQAAAELAAGAPGRALALLRSGGVSLSKDVDALIDKGARMGEREVRALAERVTAKANAGLLPVFYEALSAAISRRARDAALAGADPGAWLDARSALDRLVRDADALYLDAKQTALSALALVREAGRKEIA